MKKKKMMMKKKKKKKKKKKTKRLPTIGRDRKQSFQRQMYSARRSTYC